MRSQVPAEEEQVLSQVWHYFLQVILIGHIPPKGADTLSAYGEFYLNISKRYSDTIVGGLFGHTHHDEFQVVGRIGETLQLD